MPVPERERLSSVSTSISASSAQSNTKSGEEWMDGVPFWVLATIRAVFGVSASIGGSTLAFLYPNPTAIQSAVIAGLFSFGLGMLASFFMGKLTFKRKNAIVATGSFALFLILLYYFRPETNETAALFLAFWVV